MPLTYNADTDPNPLVASIAEDEPAKSVALLSAALAGVRETVHGIEDRVRLLLTPDGCSIAELKILIVDDHTDAADSLVAVLDIFGCTCRACYNGWSALDALEEFPPDVCLLDLMMPGLNGLELAARLQVWAGHRPLLLIATTALGDEQSRVRSAVAGFHCHLTKPIDAETLIATISRLWKDVVEQERNRRTEESP